jgi:S-(hydroxymethyl)glutathione dehydrogenase/alcohol dehydrogenase
VATQARGLVRAAVLREQGRPLTIEELVLAPPGPGEVEVRVAACGICHSDISYLTGAWETVLPAVYGHEAAGVVVGVGAGVTGVFLGQRALVTLVRSCGTCFFCDHDQPALCDARFPLDPTGPLSTQSGDPVAHGFRTGAFAERIVVHASQVVPIPDELPFDCASLLACGVLTGYGAVTKTSEVESGASVVVIGAGGVGLNSVQAAALSGAAVVVAVDLDESKLQAARTFGATHTVNPQEEDVRASVQALTEGRGADYVFVTVGSTAAMESGMRLVRRGGDLVVVGMTPAGATVPYDPTELSHDGRSIIGSKMGSAAPAVDVPLLAALYSEGRLKLDELISGRYPFEQINEAVASTAGGGALRNVIVFEAGA